MAILCISCNTQLPDQAPFCWKCGTPQKQAASVPQHAGQSTWEHKEFVYAWERKYRYWVTINRWGNDVLSEPQYRLSLWQHLQSELMPEIQKWFDDGWEPVTEVGPASLKIRIGTGYAKGYKPVGKFIFTTVCIILLPIGWAVILLALADYAEVTEVRVQMRRGRRIRS